MENIRDAQEYMKNIIIENGILRHAGEHLDLKRRVLVVTDSGVPREYSEAVAEQCDSPVIAVVPAGEESKCFDRFKYLLATMLENSFSRGDCVVAVGGGVVGDLSGFAASCYMRGIDFYNVPTTLLSQIDSSIGGKTAIDFEGIKNIIGSFYQPKKVLIDPTVLSTLDRRQLAAGLMEAVKIAAVRDAELFSMIERLENTDSDLSEIIKRSVFNKAEVVAADPKESGVRKILNFGHTIGHAIESKYNGELLHGECVALGMLPMASETAGARIKALMERFGVPTHVEAKAEDLALFLSHDKKTQGSVIKTVVVDEIGRYRIEDMTVAELTSRLEVRS